MVYIILSIVIIIGAYFAFRYFTLLYAFKKIIRQISDIRQDLTQNQMLHLPIPNKHLGSLLSSFNETLEEMRNERQEYARREKEFQSQIENISHDLRTPLTGILGYLKYIKKSEDNQLTENKELAEAIDIIEHKAETMKHLAAQFYDYSRLNAGDFQLPLSNVDVSRTLREALLGNYQILEQAHLDTDIDIPDCPMWVLGEESALERIFLNLFQNVSRYADTYFRITAAESKQCISIAFINDTKILSGEDIPHLFERFYMQDYSRNQDGSGLGLTVAKALAEEMGGTLEAAVLDKDLATNKCTVCFELHLKGVL